MKMPPIVSPQEWNAARENLLVKEKQLTRARDALAAQRRRMPRMAVAKDYRFEGPDGPVSLIDPFDAWTSAEVIRRWWQAELGWETSEAEIDLRVGGVVRVVMQDPGKDADHGGGGRYTEIDPPTRRPAWRSPGYGTATRGER